MKRGRRWDENVDEGYLTRAGCVLQNRAKIDIRGGAGSGHRPHFDGHV